MIQANRSGKRVRRMVECVGDFTNGQVSDGRIFSTHFDDGLLRTKARRFITDKKTFDDEELPTDFWWARGHEALDQNWVSGDFETRINREAHWKAYGVRFFRTDVEMLLPPSTDLTPKVSAGDAIRPRRVFVVHGHEEGPRDAVARFLEQIGFEAIILHERANQGRTVIEKVEAHGDVGFAVVLLTPDDVGCVKEI